MAIPMDMRFPDTLTDEQIDNALEHARMIAAATEADDEANPNWTDPPYPERIRMRFTVGVPQELADASIEFTDLSGLYSSAFRKRDGVSIEDHAQLVGELSEYNLSGWCHWVLDNHVLPVVPEATEGVVSIDLIPHLMKAAVEFMADGRKFIVPVDDSIIQYAAAVKQLGPELAEFRMGESDLDYCIGALRVHSLPLAEFDEWERRYRSQAWPRVSLS